MAQVVCCCSHHKSMGSIPGHSEDCCGQSGTERDLNFSVSISALMLHTLLLLSGQVAKAWELSKQCSFGYRQHLAEEYFQFSLICRPCHGSICHRPLTAQARVGSQVNPCERFGGQSCREVGLLQYFGFSPSAFYYLCSILTFVLILLLGHSGLAWGTIKQTNATSDIGKHWTEQYFHTVFFSVFDGSSLLWYHSITLINQHICSNVGNSEEYVTG